MTIEIKEKGSDRFYREVINVISQYRYLLKKPRRKIKNYFKEYTVLLIICAMILLLDVVSICLFDAGTGEKIALVTMIFLIVLLGAYVFRLNKLKKTMLADPRTSTLTLDEYGVTLNKENTQELRVSWDGIVFVRILKEGVYFVTSQQTGIVISVIRKYENEILPWLREHRPGLEIIAE